MPRFFLPSDCFDGVNAVNGGNDPAVPEENNDCRVVIRGEDARHISRSLRMKVGEAIVLCDMKLKEYSCVIDGIGPDSVTVKVRAVSLSKSEMPCFVTLYQALPKGDKMDTVIQKAVELGACRIVPVQSERCIVKLDGASADKKIARWQKIAREASGQCGRGMVCEVAYPVSFEKAIEQMKNDDLYFACYEGDTEVSLKDILPKEAPSKVSFLIGPEGGLSFGEVGFMKEKNMPLCGLGKRILRTETASSYVLSGLSFVYEL